MSRKVGEGLRHVTKLESTCTTLVAATARVEDGVDISAKAYRCGTTLAGRFTFTCVTALT